MDTNQANGGNLNFTQMPITALMVLGILSTTGEELTAGEVKVRADHSFSHFYWSPAVSHIRRELNRLLEVNLVEERRIDSGKRTITVYFSTNLGDRVLRAWAESLPVGDMVIKHPLMLKLWFATESDVESSVQAVDEYIEIVMKKLSVMHWARRRTTEIGLRPDDGPSKMIDAVSRYQMRALYSEISNVRQLRDEILWHVSPESPDEDLGVKNGVIRKRAKSDPDS